MKDGKKFISPFKEPLERAVRVLVLVWGFFVLIGALSVYLQPFMPRIVGGISLASLTWVVIAIVRWRRSKW